MELVKKFKALLGIQSKQTVKPAAKRSNALPRKKRINENTVVYKQYTDLPKYFSILSNADKKQQNAKPLIPIINSYRHAICILKTSTTEAVVLASISISEDPDFSQVIKDIRERLNLLKLDLKQTLWALPEIVDTLSKQSSDSSAVETTSFSKSDNEQLFREMCQISFDEGATDFHLESKKNNAQARLRIDTELHPLPNTAGGQIMTEQAQSLISHVFTWLLNDNSNSSGNYNPQQYRNCTVTIKLKNEESVKLRVQSNPTIYGPDMIARFLKESVSRTFEELGYSPDQIQLLRNKLALRKGIMYFAGIPNSGKTTTTRACLESIPNKEFLKLVMIADPIEYELPGVSNVSIQRSHEDDGSEYQEAIQSWLRGNPDVMDIGEVRDPVSGMASLTIGEVGCLCIATIHAHSTIGTIQRLTSPAIGVDVFALTAPEMLSLLVYQALVPILCNDCKIPLSKMDEHTILRMKKVGEKFKMSMDNTYFRAHNSDCPTCKGRGNKGVTLVAEMIDPTPEFLKKIQEKDVYGAEKVWKSAGDNRFDTPNMKGKDIFCHALYKSSLGIIDPHVVERFKGFDVDENPNFIFSSMVESTLAEDSEMELSTAKLVIENAKAEKHAQ